MASLWQITWRWTGFTGAPGFTNLYFAAPVGDPAEALAAATKSRLLFAGISTALPSATHIDLATDVKLIDEIDGETLGIVTVSGITTVGGGSVAEYSGPVGACIDWPTLTLHAGRRMQGRTFLVPLARTAFSADGTLENAFVVQFATAAEAMRTATGPTFGVWGRPRAAKPAYVPPLPAIAGLWGPAVSSRVPDMAAVLRSRRD
jgi:hypothetical protein